MVLSGVFIQAPIEVKRYVLDYTAQLATGETVTNVVATVSSLTDNSNVLSFIITNIAIAPNNTQAVFYASGGLDENQYLVKFIATTSLSQTWEDIVQFTVQDKED